MPNREMQADAFSERGWAIFPAEPAVCDWVARTLPLARATVNAPEHANWLRYGNTWFAGVNVLPNDVNGAVPGGVALAGQAVGP